MSQQNLKNTSFLECTFIILDKETYADTKDEIESMIGDTNLFFPDPENPYFAEAEIMIAEDSFRGKKRGWEAMLLMLHYGISELKVNKYQVKIGEDNEKSLAMFKKMEFEFVERSEVFKEVTFVKEVTPQWRNWIEINVNFIKIKNCDIQMISSVFIQRRAQQQKEKEKKEKEQKENDDNDKKIKEEDKGEPTEES